jgi:hypothetical protein
MTRTKRAMSYKMIMGSRYRLINFAQHINAASIRNASLAPAVDEFSGFPFGFVARLIFRLGSVHGGRGLLRDYTLTHAAWPHTDDAFTDGLYECGADI